MRNNSNLFARTSWVSSFKTAIYSWSSDLDPQIIRAIKANIDLRTFYHVTSVHNWKSIQKEGLKAAYGGQMNGLSGVMAEFKNSCESVTHLCRNDFPLPKFIPLSKYIDPLSFYQMAYLQSGMDPITITVIIPKYTNNKFSLKRIALNKELEQLPGIFKTDKKLMPLIEDGIIERDYVDNMPGRYRTVVDFPPNHLFAGSLADSLKKNEVSDAVIDTLVPENISTDKKRAYLEAACGQNIKINKNTHKYN